MKTFVFRSWMIGALRRVSYRYPARYSTLTNARVERGKYMCELCKTVKPRKEVQIDHIDPVVPITGFPMNPDGTENWTVYIKRMFPGPQGFQCVCIECHSAKTLKENQGRVKARAKRKK